MVKVGRQQPPFRVSPKPSDDFSWIIMRDEEGVRMCRPLCAAARLDLQWQSNYFSPFSDKQPLGRVCEYVHKVPHKHVYVTGFGGAINYNW